MGGKDHIMTLHEILLYSITVFGVAALVWVTKHP